MSQTAFQEDTLSKAHTYRWFQDLKTKTYLQRWN